MKKIVRIFTYNNIDNKLDLSKLDICKIFLKIVCLTRAVQ